MSVATKDPHKAEFIDNGSVTISCLWFTISLEVSSTTSWYISNGWLCTSADRAHTLILLWDILNLPPAFHLLVVHVKRLIRILNDEWVVHRDWSRRAESLFFCCLSGGTWPIFCDRINLWFTAGWFSQSRQRRRAVSHCCTFHGRRFSFPAWAVVCFSSSKRRVTAILRQIS